MQRLFFFAVARQIQFCLLLMRCVSLSLGKLSVVNRVIEGFVQFLARRIVADVDGLAVLFRHIIISVYPLIFAQFGEVYLPTS